MMQENYFIILGRLPSLNDYTKTNRSHWSKGAAMKKQIEADIMWQIKGARGKGHLQPVENPVMISFEWHESDKRRDLDNIFSAKKFILDAMQRAGIIVNDNRKHVRGLHDTIVDDKEDYVRVIIHTLPN